ILPLGSPRTKHIAIPRIAQPAIGHSAGSELSLPVLTGRAGLWLTQLDGNHLRQPRDPLWGKEYEQATSSRRGNSSSTALLTRAPYLGISDCYCCASPSTKGIACLSQSTHHETPNDGKLLLVKGIAGLGNRILCALTGILYARLAGRKVCVDWRD